MFKYKFPGPKKSLQNGYFYTLLVGVINYSTFLESMVDNVIKRRENICML
jgi:hypothetical protein